MTDNPDLQALHTFLADGRPFALTSSPLLAALSARITAANPATGDVTLTFDPPEMFRQGAGVLQGGIVAALLDFGMAFASFLKLPSGQAAVTTMLTTQYMTGVGPGSCTVTGAVTRAGRRVIHTRAELMQDGRLAASAVSTLAVV